MVLRRWTLLLPGVAAPAAVVLVADSLHPLGVAAAVPAAAVLLAVTCAAVLRRRRAAAPGDVPLEPPSFEQPSLDHLTGLADRRALRAALVAALHPTAPSPTDGEYGPEDEEDEEDGLVALVVVDLDGFKDVNDRFGHGTGDALLRRTAERLAVCLPPGAVLARLGGDEFAVLLRGSEAARARLLAERVAAAVAAAPAEGASWRTSASVGVAFADDPADDPDDPAADTAASRVRAADELLRRTELAMYSAKASGGGVRLYDPAGDLAKRERALLADELRAALSVVGAPDRGETAELVVHYQAQVSAGSGRVGGVEALVRWRHPRHGLMGPEAFLAIAEEQDLITRLTERVLRTALLDARAWHGAGHRVRVAVNVSASCLTSPALLPMVDAALAESGVEPGLLVVEVTETTLMSEPQQALATARRLRDRGVQLSIDDYGTGYSSLSYLSDLPATELKLDRAFTARVLSDPVTAAIVASTVDLAHRLGLRLVVEGVEDAPTLAAVRAAGCDETQGFLHGRAEPAAEVTRRLSPSAPEPAPEAPAAGPSAPEPVGAV